MPVQPKASRCVRPWHQGAFFFGIRDGIRQSHTRTTPLFPSQPRCRLRRPLSPALGTVPPFDWLMNNNGFCDPRHVVMLLVRQRGIVAM